MSMKKHVIAAALAIGFGLGIAVSANAAPININPQGAGGTIAVNSLDWLPGNVLCTGVGATSCVNPTTPGGPPPTPIQIYGHGRLGTFVDVGGNPIAAALPYEWTYVFGFREAVVPAGPTNANFFVIPGGSNFFEVRYEAVADSSNLTGTGFNDGILILAGTVLPFDPVTGSGNSTFAATAIGNAPLDSNPPDQYPGVLSNTGTGSSDFTAFVTFAHPDFFPDGIGALRVFTDTFQNQPFQQTNPSSCFWDGTAIINGAGPNTAGGPCTVNTVGAINGVSGPNQMLQTDATSSFLQVPEPGSLVLVGLGLLSLIGFSRRKIS
jgi:hypothetical protein